MGERVARVLAVGGGSDLRPRLRAMFPGLRTVALCRAAALGWVRQLEENEMVVVLNDDSPMERWLAAGRYVNAEYPLDRIVAMADLDQDKAAAIAADLGIEFYSPALVERVHDKVAMRDWLRARGIDLLSYRGRWTTTAAAWSSPCAPRSGSATAGRSRPRTTCTR